MLPAQAIDRMAVAGAGFAGFAAWLDMTPADPVNNEQFLKQFAIVWEDEDSRVIDSKLPWQKLL